MAYEPRTFQAVTTNTPPTGTDPMVDNTANGDVQAIKILDGTAGSTTPLAGQKARAVSLSTTLSTEDIAALTPPAAITGYATAAKQDTQITAEQAILAKLLAAPATEAKQDAEAILIGGVTEAAPGTDTASSGLNGRLQRIAQRLTSLITALGSPFQAGGSIGNTTFASTQSGTWNINNVSGTVSLPTGAATAAKQPALGTAGAASADVITVQGIASGTTIPVTLSTVLDSTNDSVQTAPKRGTLTAKNSTIATGGAAQTLAASNTVRQYLMVQNQSSGDLYICFTGTAVADKTSMKLIANASWESPAGYISTQAVSIIGATTGQAFYAVEG